MKGKIIVVVLVASALFTLISLGKINTNPNKLTGLVTSGKVKVIPEKPETSGDESSKQGTDKDMKDNEGKERNEMDESEYREMQSMDSVPLGFGGSSSRTGRCMSDPDCGGDRFGKYYCVEERLYQDRVTYICVNPGSSNSYCMESRTPLLIKECEICYNGECVEEEAKLLITPSEVEHIVGEEFELNVEILSSLPVFGAEFDLHFDTSRLELINLEEGDFLNGDGAQTYVVRKVDNDQGKITFAVTRFDTDVGVSGSGVLGVVKLRALSKGSSTIKLENILVIDADMKEIPSSGEGGVVRIA